MSASLRPFRLTVFTSDGESHELPADSQAVALRLAESVGTRGLTLPGPGGSFRYFPPHLVTGVVAEPVTDPAPQHS